MSTLSISVPLQRDAMRQMHEVDASFCDLAWYSCNPSIRLLLLLLQDAEIVRGGLSVFGLVA